MIFKAFFLKNIRALFYFSWIVLNLFLAAQTGLLDDEAYYWVYSRFLDWGYYDHPPMIAILIKAGYALFQNEFGVRLLIVLMSTATLVMIDKLCEKRNDLLFYTIAASMFLLQIGSILAVPDLPLMFFIALYFVVYREFLKKATVRNSMLLGLVIACMLYSKYHGILIVFFTLISNLKLFRQWQTYLSAAVAAILFLPHGFWQISHGMPSVAYHLFERNATQYQLEFTVQYIIGQFLIAGPLIGWLVLTAAFTRKPQNQFEKTLKWTTVGIFSLFLVATFKGRSEANWTVPAFVGLIVLAHQELTVSPRLKKWAYWLLVPSLLLVLATRIYMMSDVKPQPWLKKDEFHKTAAWARAVKDSAKGMPVVFPNSYQRASQYWFYTGDTSFALNCIQYRRSNYNFWPLEERLQGRKVMLVYPGVLDFYTDSLPNERKQMYFKVVDSFFSYSQINIIEQGDAVIKDRVMRTRIFGPSNRPVYKTDPRIFLVLYAHDNDVAYTVPSNMKFTNMIYASVPVETMVDLSSVKPGKYRYKWAIESSIPGWPTLNSSSKELLLK
ncbi:MAG TPA: glycosyltransferase family 39 protein [Chitinophagaceae bacterium]|nr:glycosyltransferase family 39 protein [Chitinophagaceae bacterium]